VFPSGAAVSPGDGLGQRSTQRRQHLTETSCGKRISFGKHIAEAIPAKSVEQLAFSAWTHLTS
jgi:hypothetical protein